MFFSRAVSMAIVAKRAEKKMTLRKLSRLSKVSLGYLSEIERGKKEPSSSVIENIAYALDVPTYELIFEAGKLMEQDYLKLPISWSEQLQEVN